MKKTFFLGLCFLGLGLLCGKILYQKTNGVSSVFKSKDIYYFLQEGVYSTEELMKENTKDLENKLVTTNDDNYHVYLGITKDLDNAKKICNLYKKKGYDIYMKEMSVDNEEFSYNLDQFDQLISSSKKLDDILIIEEVVLANYQEVVQKS